jgi:hypothetical protein
MYALLRIFVDKKKKYVVHEKKNTTSFEHFTNFNK